MKKLFLYSLFAFMFCAMMNVPTTQAQVLVQVGTTASVQPWYIGPFLRYYDSQHQQYLVTAAEMTAGGGAPGRLNSIGFNVSLASAGGNLNYQIRMKHTTATNLSTVDIVGLQEVYAPKTLGAVNTGWFTLNFDTPFEWDGVSNILVDVCHYNACGTWISEFATVNGSSVSGVSTPTLYFYQDCAQPCATTSTYGVYTQRPTMRFDLMPAGVTNYFPKGKKIPGMADSTILKYNTVYDGANTVAPANSRPGLTFRSLPGWTTTFTYTISGPLPSNNIVYRAMTAGGSTTLTAPDAGGRYFIPNANGLLANPASPNTPNGTGFLSTAFPYVQGGTYRMVIATTSQKGTSSFQTNIVDEFTVAVDRDLQATTISRPQTKDQAVYYKGTSFPLTAMFRNTGLESIHAYQANVSVRSAVTNQVVFETVVNRSSQPGGGLPTVGLLSGESDEFNVTELVINDPGEYILNLCGSLIDPNPDQQEFNDCIPRVGQEYRILVRNLFDYEVVQVTAPSSGIYSGRPAIAKAILANNGQIADLVTATLNITRLPNIPVVVNQPITVEVPNGLFNTIEARWPEFIPQDAGQYEICVSINPPGDEVPSNNQQCATITVLSRLSGEYTIGTTKPGPRNFGSLQSAVDALYQQGIQGPVKFYFTDKNYSIASLFADGPALDLSARIIGVDSKNTITFAPEPNTVGLSKGSVTIQLKSKNGIGVQFGQNLLPANLNSVQREFPTTQNANSYGYITFDGGAQKSLKFQLHTSANRRAVFYVGGRTYNHTIQNCIIENDPLTPETDFRADLPGVTINSNAFVFAPDSMGAGSSFRTFTVGIFQRNTPPADANGTNRARMDTAIVENNITYRGNKGNKFIGNEIRGFAYGIASIGIGALKDRSRIVRYYNTGTEIRENRISRVRRAGIFMGYEENSIIANNKIFDVGISATGIAGEANGIELGGQRNPIYHIGFNNIGLTVSGNEVNAVTSNVMARGIKVEQSQNDLSSVVPPPGDYLQPASPERTTVASNVIWGITRTASGASRAGIHYLTDRNTTIQGINGFITARVGNYFTRQDRISNNTVWFTNDGISNSGAVVGIGVQHARMTELKNNAIVMLSDNASADLGGGYPHTGMFIQAVHPKYAWSNIKSDYNAFWAPSASLARFIEIDSISQNLVLGYQDEYQTARQWRAWTGQDINSLWGRNFTNDYTITGTFPIQYLRIRTNPEPVGSVLSNRGERLSYVSADVDNNSRGAIGQNYDIGADEFTGIPFVNDVEVTAVLRPLTYRSGASQVNFADAEYVMAGDQIYNTDSVPVFARLRNNSTLSQVVTVVGESSMETSAGSTNAIATYPGMSQIGSKTVEIAAGQSKDVYLGTLRPQALKGLPTYNTPIWMNAAVNASMRDHVSPRYRIQARITTSDEYMGNNVEAMDARFYLRRSSYGMITSVENRSYNHTAANGPQSDPNYARSTVGRLNSDSLVRGLRAMGMYAGTDNIFVNNVQVYHYDIFDRQGWESRAVDYTPYRTIWWSQDNGSLSRFEREDLRSFIMAGKLGGKKNLVMASQEVVKQHVGLDAANDEFFLRYQLRTQRGRNNAGGWVTTPMAGGYNQRNVVGMSLEKLLTEQIRSTGFMNGSWSDPTPMPALLGVYTDKLTQGLARTGFKYANKDVGVRDSAMAVTNASEGFNTVYLGADWRHFGITGTRTGVERVLRGIMDYLTANYGYPNPVELVDFNAAGRGRSVDVSWTTASEEKSGWFEVERSVVRSTGRSEFTTIGQVSAAGTSSIRRDYNYRDMDVENGGRYAYRLRMVDLDGTTSNSDEVEVEIGAGTSSVSEVSPNPISEGISTAKVTVGMVQSGDVEVRIYDMSGTEVNNVNAGYRSSGDHVIEVPTGSLTSGVYRLVISAGGTTETRTMSVVR